MTSRARTPRASVDCQTSHYELMSDARLITAAAAVVRELRRRGIATDFLVAHRPTNRLTEDAS